MPDSLLAALLDSLENSVHKPKIQVAPNEGIAIALAAGHYLGSGKSAMVYMQNSGLPNALNPLASLAHREIYGIPIFMVIGWRGAIDEDGNQKPDEPQHMIQGAVTREQLRSLQIPFEIGSSDYSVLAKQFQKMYDQGMRDRTPTAVLIPPGIFDTKTRYVPKNTEILSSYEVIKETLDLLPKRAIIVGSTGMIGRELLKITEESETFEHEIFLNIGAMGHASSIAKGIAQTNPKRIVVCIDGDGALVMHFGAISMLQSLQNYKHIIINNSCHDSVGRQASNFAETDLSSTLSEFSVNRFIRITKLNKKSKKKIKKLLLDDKNCVIEFLCSPRESHELPRPKGNPSDLTPQFIAKINENRVK